MIRVSLYNLSKCCICTDSVRKLGPNSKESHLRFFLGGFLTPLSCIVSYRILRYQNIWAVVFYSSTDRGLIHHRFFCSNLPSGESFTQLDRFQYLVTTTSRIKILIDYVVRKVQELRIIFYLVWYHSADRPTGCEWTLGVVKFQKFSKPSTSNEREYEKQK